ncbi:TetR/AcrR family transcriptional regulator [Gordonia terrae]|uniref:TetR/AcrR family transcriptional regulator n=1 Tax=Gordonia terrae TaxID=2055 RepID=UPI003F6B22E7
MSVIERVPDPSARAQILTAGLELMGTQGYSATSVAQICTKSGTKNGSLYHYFGSKAGLLAEILDRGSLRVVEGIERGRRTHGTDTIENLFLGAADAIIDEILYYRLTLFVILEHPEEADVVATVDRFRVEVDTAIAAMIEPFAVALGADNPTAASREAAEFTIHLTRGAAISERFSAEAFRSAMLRSAQLVKLYLEQHHY